MRDHSARGNTKIAEKAGTADFAHKKGGYVRLNVLVFILSMINLKDGKLPQSRKYIAPDGRTVEGIQTNEAAEKYLISRLADSGEKLGKIIAVTSREAEASGKQRFIDGINEFCGGKFDIENIKFVNNYSDSGSLADELVLANVLSEISSEDTVYLDVSGGRRTDVNMMLLLMKLVRYKGIKVADAFYSDYDGTISSHSRFYRSLDILDGVNQFVTTGSAMQLAECYSSIPEDSPVKQLLAGMIDFSDNINLCSLSGIEDTLSKMKDLIIKISKSGVSGMDMFLFREIIPIIRDKFFGAGDNPDYCQIILWCLDNRLVQQAITLYVEKIPEFLFDKGMLSYTEELKQETIKTYSRPEKINLEKEIFFSNLMSCYGLPAKERAEKRKVDELKRSLADSDYKSGDTVVRAARDAVLKFKSISESFAYCRGAAKTILQVYAYEPKLVIIAEKVLKDLDYCTADNILNVIRNEEPLLRKLLDLPPSSTKSIITKINTIRRINEKTNFPEGITVNISCSYLKVIMADYLYARQMRNRINHAADSGDTLERLKKLFGDYKIDPSFGVASIISQLRQSVNFVLKLQEKPLSTH